MKKLRMLLTLMAVSISSWQMAWAEGEVSVTVSLSQPNSLGHEVLANLAQQGISDGSVTMVTDLTVTGPLTGELGEDDWTILKSFSSLKNLDLSGANSTAMPESQFTSSTNCKSLETVVLPANLKTIGGSAFYGQKNLVSVDIPTGVTTVGSSAFSGCSNLTTLVHGWPAGATEIPNSCFSSCSNLSFSIPEGISIIGNSAFSGCKIFNSSLPSTLTSIGSSAFSQSSNVSNTCLQNQNIVIPENCTIERSAFNNTKIKTITFPTSFYTAASFSNSTGVVNGCSNLTDITFKSPTVVLESSNFYNSSTASNITLHVPDYLVYDYKLDAKWLLYKNVVGFDPSAITDWRVRADMNLNASSRIGGTPNMYFTTTGSLTINGTAAQTFGNFTICNNEYNEAGSISGKGARSRILSGCPNVTATGDFTLRFYSYAKRWHFLSLPFDVKVSNITTQDGVKFAIRKYNGATRASENSASGNWVDCDDDEVISAYTGFIYQTSQETWTTFKAEANATRNNVFRNEEITIPLTAYACDNAANKSWNFVGNPWQTYYNIRKMNYTAPISVYNIYSRKYEAYSPTDDDFVLRPNQAFFVQKPDAVESVGFPIDGRQLTSEITTGQNGARSMADYGRRLLDIQLSNGELTDKTRLVVNDAASTGYELNCDASKMLESNTEVAQLYSLDADGTRYAINERPLADGTLQLGIRFATDGSYTFSALRNDLGNVMLTDHATGMQTNLRQDAYTFSAQAGIDDSRFTLSFGTSVTGIATTVANNVEKQEVYTLDGRKVSQMGSGIYVLRQGQLTKKVMIK